MTRFTSLGKGEKYDFTREGRGKNATIYDLKSDFDTSKPHTPAWTFGISRSFYEKAYCEGNKIIDKNIPGPGKYDFLKPFGHETSKFSMTGKGESKGLSKSSKIPGPGEYPIVAINPFGKYPISNVKNVRNVCFGVGREKRFNYSCKYIVMIILIFSHYFIAEI